MSGSEFSLREIGRKDEDDLPPRTQQDGPPDGAPTMTPRPQEIKGHGMCSLPKDHSPVWMNIEEANFVSLNRMMDTKAENCVDLRAQRRQ